jgi:O-antigen ligase
MVGVIGGITTLRAAGLRFRFSLRTIGLLAGGTALLAAFVAVAAWRGGAFERLAATDTVDETRLLILPPLLRTASAFMPWGSGFGSFDRVYRQFEPDSLLSSIYLNAAHDEPLQLAIEGGMPALVLLALFLLWWGRQAWRVLLGWTPPRHRAMRAASLTVSVVLMGSSLVDYPLRTPLLGALFAFACVNIARAGEFEPDEAHHGA